MTKSCIKINILNLKFNINLESEFALQITYLNIIEIVYFLIIILLNHRLQNVEIKYSILFKN